MQHIEELDPVFNFEILKNFLLQRFNANETEFMRKYFQTVFHKRALSEDESLQAYAFVLKVLANKAYPNINLHNLENIIIYQLAKGLGISAWSEHVLYHCPNSIKEAIDIALGHEIFSGCCTCSHNQKYNVLDETFFLQTNKTSSYKLNTQNTNIHRSKPFKKKHDTNYKCKGHPTHILFGVCNELKQLQSFVSTERDNDCHLTEVVVEIPLCVSKAHNSEALCSL